MISLQKWFSTLALASASRYLPDDGPSTCKGVNLFLLLKDLHDYSRLMDLALCAIQVLDLERASVLILDVSHV